MSFPSPLAPYLGSQPAGGGLSTELLVALVRVSEDEVDVVMAHGMSPGVVCGW